MFANIDTHRIRPRRAPLALAVLLAAATALVSASAAEEGKAGWSSKPGTYAVFETSEGKIVCRLFEKESPITVENFIGLAEGTKEFTDPGAGAKAKRPYYDGTKFHRIIPNFMMQGGDPTASGSGGPGYRIKDEFAPGLSFSKPGILAMANAGPNTGGSQFFITQAATTWLDGKHTIFGEVVEGLDVVNRVCGTLGTKSGKPTKDVMLNKLTIQRVAAPGGTSGEKPSTRPSGR